ncbi:MAG: GNAT family N-acetyltransferase [candidate division WOR-3 bacterium]|nr:MAG: GNAT family N-acetyltransferase [candidate division WOR-3 bacterium]
MMLKRITEMTSAERQALSTLVDECAYSTPFHRIEWLHAIESILNKAVFYLVDQEGDGTATFGLPLIFKRGMLFPEMHSFSMEYDLVYGGPLLRKRAFSEDGPIDGHVAASLKPAKSLIVTLPPRFPVERCKGSNLKHICNTPIFDLSPTVDELWNGLPYKNVRCNINRANKCGVRVIPGSIEHLDYFHEYLKQTLAFGGKEALPAEYYKHVARFPFSHICSAVQGDLPIAVAIVLTHHDTVYYWGNASSYEHRNSRPNDLLVWEIMKWAKTNGYRYFDFLITPLHSLQGVTRFKLKFNAGIHPIYQYRLNNFYQVIDKSLYYLTHPHRFVSALKPFRAKEAG